MKGKATAAFVTCLMIFGGLGAFPGAAGPAGPSGAPAPEMARGSTPDNDSEPNDDFANATLITGSATFEGGVGMGDLDYYKISLNTGATADTLLVQLTLNVGTTVLTIYDPNHFLLLQDGNVNPQTGVTLELSFTAFLSGFYYIFLPNRGPCNFTLTTVVGSAAFTGDNDNDPSHATNIVPVGDPIKTYTSTSTADNSTDIQDLYKITLDYSAGIKTDVMKAFLTVPATGTFGLLLHAEGQYDAWVAGSEPDYTLKGKSQSLTFAPTAAGTYYLRVWAPNGNGQYTLNVSKANGTADANGDFASAGALDRTAPHWYNQTGDLTLGVDQDDYFMIENILAGQVFNCSISSLHYDATDHTPNIRIELYNTSEFQIAPDPVDNLADPVAYANARADEDGKLFVHLNLTEWAGDFSLNIYTNSPPQVAAPIDNISFAENSTDTSIKLAQVFSDPENDLLNYTWEMYGDINGFADVTIGNDTNRTVSLKPNAGWRGSGSMSWKATDPSNESVSVSVHQITVVGINHRPGVIDFNPPTVRIAKNNVDTKSLNMNNIFQDPDDTDKLMYNCTGNVHIKVSFPLDQVSKYWPTGEVTLVPDMDWTGTEEVAFNATDNGVPPLSSLSVGVTIIVGEEIVEKVTALATPRMYIKQDSENSSLQLSDYFNSTAANDSFNIVYLPSNVTSHLTVIIGNDTRLTVRPQLKWSGTEQLKFRGTCQHNLSAIATLTVEVQPINYPPEIKTYSPNQTSLTMNEADSIKFKITVFDEETPVAQLKIKWTQDGVNVSSLTEYELITNYDTIVGQQSRTFVVRVTVSDGFYIVGQNWTVTVNNVNRAPRDARITFPPDGQTYDEGAKVHLIGAAADDDGDNLTYQWYDGVKLLGSGQEFNTSKLKAGKHNITLNVSDGSAWAEFTIIIKINAKKSPGFEAVAVAAVAAIALTLVGLSRRRKK